VHAQDTVSRVRTTLDGEVNAWLNLPYPMKKALSVSLVLVTLTACFLLVVHTLRKEAGKTARGAIEMVKQILNVTPEVTITSYVTRQKTADIFELASVSKEFPIEYHYENKQLGSTKRLDLVGQYTVKAGFELRERFSIQVDQTSHRVHADFPAPKILSVEQKSYKVTKDDNGWWNGLTQKDQEAAVNDMHAKARAEALEMRVCDEAKASLRRQLLDLAKKAGQEWEITFRDERPLVIERSDPQ
jgi:hypothetical protein